MDQFRQVTTDAGNRAGPHSHSADRIRRSAKACFRGTIAPTASHDPGEGRKVGLGGTARRGAPQSRPSLVTTARARPTQRVCGKRGDERGSSCNNSEQGVTEGKVVKDGLQEKAVEFAKGGEVYKRCDEHSPERDVNREQSGSLKVLGAQLYLQQLWQNGPL